ncbi:pentatricopeptide repeat-containing protein At2g37230 [Nymphaea colorata]|nr:pentatricopeptide repeat-containing protein At2g37230 [Nymphaea colorata]
MASNILRKAPTRSMLFSLRRLLPSCNTTTLRSSSLHFFRGFSSHRSPDHTEQEFVEDHLFDTHGSVSLKSEPAAIGDPCAEDEAVASETLGAQEESLFRAKEETRLRGKPRTPENVGALICRMMSKRAWTTRLQNSIRSLVPEFNQELVLSVLDGAKNYEQALNFFRWVEKTGFRHDRSTYLKMVQILVKDRKHNHPRCIIFDMQKKGVEWDEQFFIELMNSYAKAGIVQEAVKIFQKMKDLGVKRTVISYNNLFDVILKRGRTFMAKRYFNAMLRDGVTPNLVTYTVLIWGFSLSSKMETAKRFFDDMKTRGLVPDVVCYNTIINGFCRSKNMEEAEKCLAEMKGNGLKPDIVTFTSLIKGYAASDRVDEGLKLFNELGSHGVKPNVRTYVSLLPYLCERDRMTEAHKLLNEMVKKRFVPNDRSIFISMMAGHCKSGHVEKAFQVLRAMDKLQVHAEPMHYSMLFENFCKAGKPKKAVELLDEVLNKGLLLIPVTSYTLEPRSNSTMEPSAYNPVIKYLCENGQTQKAEIFLRQLMKCGIEDSTPFNNLVMGHSKEGMPEAAVELLKIMNRRGISPDSHAYCLLVKSFLEKGDPAEAKISLDGMIESGHLPSASLLREVMESLFNDGRVQTASRVMKSMLEKDVRENLDIVAKILEALLMRGHVEEALGRIVLMTNKECPVDIDHLLDVLCKKDKTIAAVKLLDFALERNYSVRFSSYDLVLDALCSAGKTLTAYAILCKICERGGAANQIGCKALIKSLNAEGHTKQADILSRMILGKDSSSKKANKGAKISL